VIRLTAHEMGALIGNALTEDGISQAEFCRQVGVSEKHLSNVINGKATASPVQLEMWAFALGRRWRVDLVPLVEVSL
jgi:transcriptional regulator with XRE-family HTH domain